MKAPDYKAGMLNLIVLTLIALALVAVAFKKLADGDFNGAAIYIGFLFIDFGVALYSFRVAIWDGTGYKEVKD
ncbi:hypothetical protein GJ688_05730 [Heliobacillus mobilis]|uniref:Uncharacterized protein n=2 Tax=Heliobacterium TaxID=2697 RepID=Q9ZGG2_HELMO|nr:MULTISPECIES: hypothetical protein [Heliobacterium]AAC84017.1 unknown [Heliobacterium mobile]MBC9784205.1 hypothetical protein [Heliobacterium chlorum]MTV48481.1 hypothetical protein [Heliobacterium mobile]